MSPSGEEYDQFSHEHSLENLTNMFVVACIPAFNEEKNIGGVVVKALKFVDRVVVCDDGSSDLTGDIARGLGAIVVRHERNMGYGATLKSLFHEAMRLGADIVVTLDGDGQHDPRDIPRLLRRLERGDTDIVIGSRFVEGGKSEAPYWRENGIKFISKFVSNDKITFTDAQSGLRAYNRKVLESITLTEDGMGVSTEILLKAQESGIKVSEVPVSISYTADSSAHNPLLHGFEVVLSTLKYMSIRRPLLFYGLPGFIFLCLATIFWSIALRIYTITHTIRISVSLIAIGTSIIGLMLMTTSIILWVLISIIREK